MSRLALGCWLLCFVSGTASLCAVAWDAFLVQDLPEDEASPSPLRTELRLDAPAHVGEPMHLSAALINGSDDHVLALRPVDASDCGWRSPRYLVTISRPDGTPFHSRIVMRCKRMADLRAADFFVVRAHAEADPFAGKLGDYGPLRNFRPDAPGVWTIALAVEFEPTKLAELRADESLMPLLRWVPPTASQATLRVAVQ